MLRSLARTNHHSLAVVGIPLVAFALVVPSGHDHAQASVREVSPAIVGERDWRSSDGGGSPSASADAVALPFAEIGGTQLYTPSPAPLIVGFHQANGPTPLALTPVGEHVEDHFEAVGAWDGVGSTGYTLLPTRVRGSAPTSAVDIVVAPDEPVLSVVTGTVVDASTYSLYGNTRDVIIAIKPDSEPSLLVKILHVDDARVTAGDRVVAGETVVSSSGRTLPFGSQVDRFIGERLPHVHIEVVRG